MEPLSVFHTFGWKLLEVFVERLLLRLCIVNRLMPFTMLRLKLSPRIDTMDWPQMFAKYEIRVSNKGRKNAVDCWPVLQSYPAELTPLFRAQPIAWQYDHRASPAPSFETVVIQPGETRGFTFVATSEFDSKSGYYMADVPTARRDGEYFLIGFPPGVHTVKVGVVGNNILARPLTLRIWLSEAGDDTWRTLEVQEWTYRRRLHQVTSSLYWTLCALMSFSKVSLNRYGLSRLLKRHSSSSR